MDIWMFLSNEYNSSMPLHACMPTCLSVPGKARVVRFVIVGLNIVAGNQTL